MKLRNKIIVGYLVIAALSGVVGLIGINNVTSIQQDYLAVSTETIPVISDLKELKLAGRDIMSSTSQYLFILSEEQHALAQKTGNWEHTTLTVEHQSSRHAMVDLTESGYLQLKTTLAKYKQLLSLYFHDETPYLALITHQAQGLIVNSEEIIRAKRLGMAGGEILKLQEGLETAEHDFLESINSALKHEVAELEQRNSKVEGSINNTINSLLFTVSLIFIVSLTAGLLLARALANPLEKLRASVVDFGRGKLDVSLDLSTRDEIGELATAFHHMMQALKSSQHELLANKQFLETILDNMVEEISILDPYELRILKSNQAFRDVYQITENELAGQFCYQVTHGLEAPCQAPNDYCPVGDVLKNKAAVTCEHIHTTETQDNKYCEIQVAPIFSAEGQILHVIHVARDITERKIAEQALRAFASQLETNNKLLQEKTAEVKQAHRELQESQVRILQQDKMASIGQLAAGVAHEINNPTGFIISNLNTLKKYLSRLVEFNDIQAGQLSAQGLERVKLERKRLKIDYLLEDMPELLGESIDGADRVKKIVQDLKGFSRIDQAEFASIDLNQSLDSTINIVWNEIKYNATLERDYRLEHPVSCFAQQMAQIFINLLVNASHALEEQGTIKVSTWQEGEEALISIADSGKGMSAETIEHIFEPFFTTKAVGKGTGLGLSIAYDIVKKHHGEIRVVSTPGEGACFTIRLPLQQDMPSVEGLEPSLKSV